MSYQNTNWGAWFPLIILGLMVAGFAIYIGPQGCATSCASWRASNYGSDWYVVQYAQSGCVIADWELKNEAIHNEGSSDGVYFKLEDGQVVHLSGHYTYLQSPTDAGREALAGTGKCMDE
jgi:hypothetical protein